MSDSALSKADHVPDHIKVKRVDMGYTWCTKQCVDLAYTQGVPGVDLGYTWGLPGVYLGLTWDRPEVYLRNSQGLPVVYLG